MTSKPDDEKNDIFLIKVPSEKNVDDVLYKIKTLGKKITRPEPETETEPESSEPDTSAPLGDDYTTEEPEVEGEETRSPDVIDF